MPSPSPSPPSAVNPSDLFSFFSSLLSNSAAERFSTLTHLFSKFKPVTNPHAPTTPLFPPLLSAILHHDPSANLRLHVASHPLMPRTALHAALRDPVVSVRKAAVLALDAIEAPCAKHLTPLLTWENSPEVLEAVCQVLKARVAELDAAEWREVLPRLRRMGGIVSVRSLVKKVIQEVADVEELAWGVLEELVRRGAKGNEVMRGVGGKVGHGVVQVLLEEGKEGMTVLKEVECGSAYGKVQREIAARWYEERVRKVRGENGDEGCKELLGEVAKRNKVWARVLSLRRKRVGEKILGDDWDRGVQWAFGDEGEEDEPGQIPEVYQEIAPVKTEQYHGTAA